MDVFDVIVIGGGATGENLAGRVAAGGVTTALVESELVGGECSYWACMPSKALLRPGAALAEIRRVPGAAQAVTGELDVDAALARRDRIAASWDDSGQADWVAGAGVELIRGHGRLAGERRVDVETTDGSLRALRASTAVGIATGSRAAFPPVEGLEGVGAWDNRDVTSAKQVPRRLLILGGGAVACEMAQAWRWLGTEQVTVFQRGGRLLSTEEPFASAELAAALERDGVDVRLGTQLSAVHRDARGGPVTVQVAGGGTITGDELLVAAGRRPATGDLGLDSVGLDPGAFIDVDEQLRATGVPGGWLYAAGDCNGRALLTHMGKYQARIAGDVILGRRASATALYRAVPRVVFTSPQVAAVGWTEAAARARGVDVAVGRVELTAAAASAIAGEGTRGTCQIVVDAQRRTIVGATFTGPEVGELLHAATIAIVGELTLDQLWHAVPSYPTMSEVWLRLMEACGL